MAALICAAAWTRRMGRRLLVLCVDHGLQDSSASWTAFVGEAAGRLGAEFRALKWDAPKPSSGLPAAARSARHRLLAEAARNAGARVVVMAHTDSDIRENAVLGLGPLHEWSPSPVWPQGRGVFLVRPFLGLSRKVIRQDLAADGVAYVDDPANDDLRHARARVRRAPLEPVPPVARASAADLAARVSFLPGGGLGLGRSTLAAADPERARRLLAAALTSAGGGERPAPAAGVDRLLARLRTPNPFTATLAGARLIAKEAVLITREAGDLRRKGAGGLLLSPGVPAVWDGRYEVETTAPGLTIAALGGYAARLAKDSRAALAAVPAPLRPVLPVFIGAGEPTCPILAQAASPTRLTDLVPARFLAACGAIAQESELAQAAHGASQAGVLCRNPVTE